jgi:amino-acid N-acetyltransferase
MTKEEFKINRFCAPDRQEVLDLLTGAELPIEDLSDEKMQNFMVARSEDNSIVGVVGIEMFQENGLLRSLAVQPAYRGKGLGGQLTREIESFACSNGIKTLYLLTLTAADFFSKFFYQVIHRDQAPELIQNTAEFKGLCPVSAVCLYRALDGA